MLTKTELRAKKIELSRAEISERVLEIAQMCVDSGSYKNAVACLGRMVALSKTVEDGYWNEKFSLGASMERYYLLSGLKDTHPDKNTLVT